MRLRTFLIGWAAIVFGGSAAVGAYLLAKPSGAEHESRTVDIVVAAIDTPRGVTLTGEMLTTAPWPKEYLPATALRSLEDAANRTVSVPLVKGEPVTDTKLAALGAGRGMASMIPRGMRAVTLQTPSVSTAMAGFILPGNKVDVLLTYTPHAGASPAGGSGSILLLQNVEVLAVDQFIDAPSENVVNSSGMQSVTLLVTPAEAARLDLGQTRGTLRLALRNPEDTVTAEVQPAMLSTLQLGPNPPVATETNSAEPASAPAPPEVAEQKAAGVAQANAEIAAEPPTHQPAPRRVLLPVRTLRGSSSSVLYLRQPVERQLTATARASDQSAEQSLSPSEEPQRDTHHK